MEGTTNRRQHFSQSSSRSTKLQRSDSYIVDSMHAGSYKPPIPFSQASSRSSDTQKRDPNDVNSTHGGDYEPPTEFSWSGSRFKNIQKSDADNVERMHGGLYEPPQKVFSHSSAHPSGTNAFPRNIQGEGHRTNEQSTYSHQNHSEDNERVLDEPCSSQPVEPGTSDRHIVWHASFSIRNRTDLNNSMATPYH